MHSPRMIFSKNTIKDVARLSFAKRYSQVAESEFKSFNEIATTVYKHYDETVNFFIIATLMLHLNLSMLK